MPRDFKEFAKKNENILKENTDKTEEIENILEKYKNMDNGELMSNLIKEANKLRSEGKLDNSQLNNLQSTLSPFLNSEQQSMLSNILDAIK